MSYSLYYQEPNSEAPEFMRDVTTNNRALLNYAFQSQAWDQLLPTTTYEELWEAHNHLLKAPQEEILSRVPENGWGGVDDTLATLEALMQASEHHPERRFYSHH